MKRTEKEIMAALIETVRAHLRKLDVATKDIDDLTQEVMLAAWEKVCEGEFQIHPGVNARWATEGWLFGIAWRRMSHYRDRAYRRREVLTPEPLRRARPRRVEPLRALEARSALRCLSLLKEPGIEVLLTDAEDLHALASKHNVCMRAISARRTMARRRFLALVEHLLEQQAGAEGEAEAPANQGRRKQPRCVRRIQGTRADAYRELLQPRTFRRIARWARRLGVAPNDVEDVVQEVLFQAHQSFSEYKPQYGHVTRWLNRITVHAASHYHDRAFRRRETSGLGEAPELEDPSPGAVELLQQAEVQQLVFDCIQTLPAEMREVIIAHDVDGLSMEEIAGRREVSLSTAYRLHTQGRQAFKAILLARVCVEEENAKKRRR